MAFVVGVKCVNCRTTFTIEAAVAHSSPGVCVEWENHQMFEVNFIISVVDTDKVEVDVNP